ncbi:hypothetical protein GSI_02383 [Ganoderma sinense ZZ0214-1]|uniref:Putative gamma-glutamylcyclotransferase n=1 Tax=Ganoderma sinense ZZ0214-1 TaxID=1077348 RepID=A0A2G8SPK5_9APHY|nr:hypothetical protein GSI_02383 [Ganoderma sinense ZZ0214-1]
MSHSAFFYGTLLHPSILRRVIGHEGSGLEICPALLQARAHPSQDKNYPAVLPHERSRELFAEAGHEEPPADQRNVRGTLVTGLNDKDIALLDLFEGDEYTRESVLVHPLGPFTALSSTPVPRTTTPSVGAASIPLSQSTTNAYLVPLTAPELPPLDLLPPPLPAQTYIYAGPLSDLSPELWSYEDFVRENAWKWVGRGTVDDNYAEVDRRREMNGSTLKTEVAADI